MGSQNFNNPNIPVPRMSKLLDNKKQEVKTEINCMALGTVQSFDSADQTVTVSINYLRTIYGGAATENDDSNVNNQTQAYPQLVKCPLVMLSGGSASITFPVAKGDSCIILFNDRDIDTWWNTGSSSSAPNSSRVHDLNDAIVIVGIRNLQNAIQSYFNGFKITYGSAYITIDPSGNIVIQGSNVTINGSGNINVTGSGNVTITGASINLI